MDSPSPDIWQWLGGADNLTATILAVAGLTLLVRTALQRTVLKRRIFKKKLRRLSVGANRAYVEQQFGSPALGRLDNEGNGALTWISPFGYCHIAFHGAIIDRFSFTVTDPLLRLELADLTVNCLRGKLGGKVKYVDQPATFMVSYGARRTYASAAFYFGNPGYYLTYVLAYNDASNLGRFPPSDTRSLDGGYAVGDGVDEDPSQDVAELRARAVNDLEHFVANTLTIRQRGHREIEGSDAGVDLDSVRMFPRDRLFSESFHAAFLRLSRWAGHRTQISRKGES